MKTKNFKNYISILAIVNYQNWLDASPPLISSTRSRNGGKLLTAFLYPLGWPRIKTLDLLVPQTNANNHNVQISFQLLVHFRALYKLCDVKAEPSPLLSDVNYKQ